MTSRCSVTSFVRKRISKPVQPNNVATANSIIQTSATGGTPTIAICEPPPMIMPSPMTIVRPTTMLGMASFTGATVTTCVEVGSDRLAPQRLQYLSSTAISFPQDGQYITILHSDL